MLTCSSLIFKGAFDQTHLCIIPYHLKNLLQFMTIFFLKTTTTTKQNKHISTRLWQPYFTWCIPSSCLWYLNFTDTPDTPVYISRIKVCERLRLGVSKKQPWQKRKYMWPTDHFIFAYLNKELHYVPIYHLWICSHYSWLLWPFLPHYHFCFKSITLCSNQGFDIPAHIKSAVEVSWFLLPTVALNQNIFELWYIWHIQTVSLWKNTVIF